MLTSARHLRDFAEQSVAQGAAAERGDAVQGWDRFIAHVLETLHDWQVHQAEREIDRYRRSAGSGPH